MASYENAKINFDCILNLFGLKQHTTIECIHKRAWLIDCKYILKQNENQKEVEKALAINDLLHQEGVFAAEYLSARSGEKFVVSDGYIYTIMLKINGEHIDPFDGDYAVIAHNIGIEIAKLHKALKKSENLVNAYKNNLNAELRGWIMAEIKSKNINVPDEIISACLEFEEDYDLLPRQLIHRDVHLGNMLFEGDRPILLDFDISQENARIFDIVYLTQSILVGKYNNKDFVKKWRIFTESLLLSYHCENRLYGNEIEAIHKISLAVQMIFTAYFSSVNQPDLSSDCIDMAKWIFANEDVFAFSL